MTSETTSDSAPGREVEREDWAPLLTELTRHLDAQPEPPPVTLEVAGDLVGGTEVEALPVDSVTFEDRDDQIAVLLGGRDARYPAAISHYVTHPRRLWVEGPLERPDAIRARSQDGTTTVLRFRWKRR